MHPTFGRIRWVAGAILAAAVGLPLLGAWTAGRDLTKFFAFPPPLRIPHAYPHFSWVAVVLVVAPFVGLAAAWPRTRGVTTPPTPAPGEKTRAFPSWGWLACAWTVAWWILAWTRLPWFAVAQRYTFFPLWLGGIVALNAATFARGARCSMLDRPGRWLALFGVSALFWWCFEWLNRFTSNWHYLGVTDFGALGYAAHASVCFSTVLPAVTAAAELVGSFGVLQRTFATGPRWPGLGSPRFAWALIGFGALALFAAGAWPTQAYSALWSGPLALALGLSSLVSKTGVLADVARGEWRAVGTWAAAALLCGGWWELWNFHSAPKWIYTVPYVDRWHVFEMPLLGYLGYLPFGLECYFVAGSVLGSGVFRPFSSASST